MTDSNFNPYDAPVSVCELEVQVQRERRPKTTLWIRAFCALFCVTVLVALGIMAFEIESIIGSGVFLCLVAVVLCILGVRNRNYLAILVSSSAPIFCMFIFALIYTQSWSPIEAEAPVQILSWCYAGVSIPIAGWIAIKLERPKGTVEETVPGYQ